MEKYKSTMKGIQMRYHCTLILLKLLLKLFFLGKEKNEM